VALIQRRKGQHIQILEGRLGLHAFGRSGCIVMVLSRSCSGWAGAWRVWCWRAQPGHCRRLHFKVWQCVMASDPDLRITGMVKRLRFTQLLVELELLTAQKHERGEAMLAHAHPPGPKSIPIPAEAAATVCAPQVAFALHCIPSPRNACQAQLLPQEVGGVAEVRRACLRPHKAPVPSSTLNKLINTNKAEKQYQKYESVRGPAILMTVSRRLATQRCDMRPHRRTLKASD